MGRGRQGDDEEQRKKGKTIEQVTLDDDPKDRDYKPKNDERSSREDFRRGSFSSSQIMNSYSRPVQETFSCDKCTAKSDSQARLEKHGETVHGEESRRCAVCEDDFSWPDPEHECYFTKYKLRLLAGDIVPAF